MRASGVSFELSEMCFFSNSLQDAQFLPRCPKVEARTKFSHPRAGIRSDTRSMIPHGEKFPGGSSRQARRDPAHGLRKLLEIRVMCRRGSGRNRYATWMGDLTFVPR